MVPLIATKAEFDLVKARIDASAAAVAKEQEMQALVQENRAKVVLAEAEIPLALSAAFREGKIGVMDYYNMKNLQADTSMRSNIANITGGNENR